MKQKKNTTNLDLHKAIKILELKKGKILILNKY